MMIFKNMSIAVSTSIICASLFFGNVNAIPVPIVDGMGNPVMQNGAQVVLQDNAAPLPINGLGSTIYHLNAGNMAQVNRNTNINDSLYFYVAPNQYIKVDYLENNAVRNRHRQNIFNPAQQLKQRLDNITLCTKLHIEDWNDDISQYRHDNLFADKVKVINKAFQRLKRISADNGHAFIDSVKNNIVQNNDQINAIIKKYTALKICFGNNRANGNANKAIDYLLLRPVMANNEEQEFIDDIRTYFDRHLPKHFCHNTIMGNPAANFQAAGIDAPQGGSPYTSMSYNIVGTPPSYHQAQNIAIDVYPRIVNYLRNIYDFKFDIIGNNLTIRLTQGDSTPKVVNIGVMQNLAKLSANELKRIYSYNGVLPNIFNIPLYMNGGVALLLGNQFFHLFFNVGLAFNNNALTINGSLFPV